MQYLVPELLEQALGELAGCVCVDNVEAIAELLDVVITSQSPAMGCLRAAFVSFVAGHLEEDDFTQEFLLSLSWTLFAAIIERDELAVSSERAVLLLVCRWLAFDRTGERELHTADAFSLVRFGHIGEDVASVLEGLRSESTLHEMSATITEGLTKAFTSWKGNSTPRRWRDALDVMTLEQARDTDEAFSPGLGCGTGEFITSWTVQHGQLYAGSLSGTLSVTDLNTSASASRQIAALPTSGSSQAVVRAVLCVGEVLVCGCTPRRGGAVSTFRGLQAFTLNGWEPVHVTRGIAVWCLCAWAQYLVAGCQDGMLRVYDTTAWDRAYTVDVGTPLRTLRVLDASRGMLATGGLDSMLRLYSLPSLIAKESSTALFTAPLFGVSSDNNKETERTVWAISSVSRGYNHARVLCGTDGGMLYMWDWVNDLEDLEAAAAEGASSAALLPKEHVHAHGGAVRALHPAGDFVVSCAHDGLLKVWSVEALECVRVLDAQVTVWKRGLLVYRNCLLALRGDSEVEVWRSPSSA